MPEKFLKTLFFVKIGLKLLGEEQYKTWKDVAKTGKVCPKFEKMCTKLEKMCTKLEKMCPKIWFFSFKARSSGYKKA